MREYWRSENVNRYHVAMVRFLAEIKLVPSTQTDLCQTQLIDALRKRHSRWKMLERDLYFHALRTNEKLTPAQIRDRCRKDHPEWKLSSNDSSAREVVETALKKTAKWLKVSGLSA